MPKRSPSSQLPVEPKSGTRKKITLTEVAAHCKVSRATVSRILNNRLNGFPVSEETRKKVLEAAHSLGYRANRLARAIRQQRTNLIALSIPTYVISENLKSYNTPTSWMNFGECIAAVFSHPLFEKYDLVIHGRKEYLQESLSETDFQTDLLDGIIYLSPSEKHREFLEYARPDFPIVLVGRLESGDDSILSVDVNNRKAAAQLTRHLLERGCRRIVCAYAEMFENLAVTRDRIEGFRSVMREAGHVVEDSQILPVEYTHEGGRALVERFTDRDLAGIDGFVAMGEFIGGGIIEGLQGRGRSVPDKVKVGGFAFQDHFPSSQPSERGISYPCIIIPVQRQVQTATGHLLRILEGDEEYKPGFHEVEADLRIPD